MQIITTLEPTHIIDVRASGRNANIRLDVAPTSDPSDVISLPLGRRALFELLSHRSGASGEVGLLVEDKRGGLFAKNGRRHGVRLTRNESEELSDAIREVRGLAKVADRL